MHCNPHVAELARYMTFLQLVFSAGANNDMCTHKNELLAAVGLCGSKSTKTAGTPPPVRDATALTPIQLAHAWPCAFPAQLRTAGVLKDPRSHASDVFERSRLQVAAGAGIGGTLSEQESKAAATPATTIWNGYQCVKHVFLCSSRVCYAIIAQRPTTGHLA